MGGIADHEEVVCQVGDVGELGVEGRQRPVGRPLPPAVTIVIILIVVVVVVALVWPDLIPS